MIKAFWMFLWAVSTVYAAPVPPTPLAGGIEPDLQLRFIQDRGPVVLLGEMGVTAQTEQRRHSRASVGAYWVPDDHVKLGVFYRKAFGLLHDEDWFSENGTWRWRDTRNRGEDHWIFDFTPRTRILETESLSLVGEVKSRFIWNPTWIHRTLFVRPGMTVFFSQGGSPVLSAFLQYEFNFALGRSGRTLPEKWLYLGILKPLTPGMEIGIQSAIQWQSWGATPAYLAKGGTAYEIDTTTLNLGLLWIFRIP